MAYSGRTKKGRGGAVDAGRGANVPFYLYVEGPGDCAILRSWAGHLSRPLARAIDESAVIHGGRQPARARDHFQRVRALSPEASGLCILDRDDRGADAPGEAPEPGLEFFTWPRRHIESYLLVPEAIARQTRSAIDAQHVARLLAGAAPVARRPLRRRVARRPDHAKHLLSARGPVARALGYPISSAGVARAMRADELHADVLDLLERVRERAGLRKSVPAVVVRKT